ncbi:hypothetical protein P154DRAFT_411367, partial [Amniculicola lignicola CBS 123094]
PIMANNSHLCEQCNNPGTLRCGECHQSHYCSKVCQKTDFKLHKLLCKQFKDFTDDKRPSPDYYRAIYFHPAEEGPRFIWLCYG